MKGNGLGLDLAIPNVHLVAAQHDGHVLAHAGQITVPVGDVLVGDAGGDVEHDDSTLALDVVAVPEAAEFLLAGGVPDVEDDWSVVGVEGEWVYFYAVCGYVLFLEFAALVTLDEGGFAGAAVAHEHEFEGWSVCGTTEREELEWEGGGGAGGIGWVDGWMDGVWE